MKSPEEIKAGLECCQTAMTTKYKVCSKCAYYDDGYECENVLREDALDYIRQLEREKEEFVKNKLLSEGISLDLREVVKVCEGELLVAALNMISDMEAAAPKWISVEDKMPKDKELVLVYDKNYGCGIARYEAEFDCFVGFQGKQDGGLYGVISHWMPLRFPEPPEEDA